MNVLIQSLFILLFVIYSNALFGADQFVYIANTTSHTVVPINLSTHKSEPPISTGFTPSSIAITPDGLKAYVVNRFSNNVTTIDLIHHTIDAVIDVGISPTNIALTPNGQTAYVTNKDSCSITPIHIPSNTPGNVIDLGINNKPAGIAITPDGTAAYIAITSGLGDLANTIVRLDLATHTFIGSPISVANPLNIAITPDGKKAYVTSYLSHAITPIDLVTHQAKVPIFVAIFPFDVAITSDGKTAFFTDHGQNSVIPIDVATEAPNIPINVHQSPSGQAPSGIAINPNNQMMYVANFISSDVTPISLATLTPSSSIPLSNGSPYGIAIPPDQAPTASFVSISGLEESPTIFDASSSTSPVGTIATYAWDFGDGNAITVSSPVVQHVYHSSGPFLVTLTVTNSAGTSSKQIFTGQTVRNNGGPSAICSQLINIYPTLPLVNHVNPNYGLITNSQAIEIIGHHFVNVVAVKFNEVDALSFQVLSPTTIQAVVPPQSVSKTVDVTITTVSGTSPITSHNQYSYHTPPSAPSRFVGKIKKKKFKGKYVLQATWEGSPSEDIILYRVYKNGKLVEEISATSKLTFKTQLRKFSHKGFTITAVNSYQFESSHVKLKGRK